MPPKKYYVETEITLHLLPVVIARQIRKIGDKICHISLQRTHGYRDNVTVRTKAIRNESAPKPVVPDEADAEFGKRGRRCRGTAA